MGSRRSELLTQLLLTIGAVAVIFLALQVSLSYPFTDNEGAFVTMGREMGRGAQLYTDLWDHKPPFFFGQSWLIQQFIPLTEVNLHLYAFFIHALIAVFLFFFVRRLGLSSKGAWVTVFGYAVLLFYPLFQCWTVTSDLLYQPFLLGAFLAFFLPEEWLFLSGALWACAFLTKQSALLLVPVFLFLPGPKHWDRIPRWALGALLVLSLTAYYFYQSGRWIDFEAALWSFNFHYVHEGWRFFWGTPAFRAFLSSWALVALSIYGMPLVAVAAGWGMKPLSSSDRALLICAAIWLIGVLDCASGYFFSYYYVDLLPSLAMGLGWAWERGKLYQNRWAMLAVILTFAGAAALAFHPDGLYSKVFSYAEYPTQRYETDKAIGSFIASQAYPQDELLSWTDDPQLYVYSGLKPSIKTIFINHLSYMPYTAMKTYQDFQKHPPRFLVLSLSSQVLGPPDGLKTWLKDYYIKVKSLGELELYELRHVDGLK
jgi:hypothetical protein